MGLCETTKECLSKLDGHLPLTTSRFQLKTQNTDVSSPHQNPRSENHFHFLASTSAFGFQLPASSLLASPSNGQQRRRPQQARVFLRVIIFSITTSPHQTHFTNPRTHHPLCRQSAGTRPDPIPSDHLQLRPQTLQRHPLYHPLYSLRYLNFWARYILNM